VNDGLENMWKQEAVA